MEVDLFFHGNIDRETSECRLMLFSNIDGTYLIRSKDETNYVISVFYKKKIAHYLIIKQADGRVTWDSTNFYSSIEKLIAHHSTERIGMVTTLTVGCPVKHFIVQDSLFPTHQCSGLCWFHGRLVKEEVNLRMAITDPSLGSFLVVNSQAPGALYTLCVWINNKVVRHEVLEVRGELRVSLDISFTNLLELIRHYMGDDSLGSKLMQPCCVTAWHQRRQITHPSSIIPDFRVVCAESGSSSDEAPGSFQRGKRLAMRTRRKGTNLSILNLSNLSLSDNDSHHSYGDGEEMRGGVGFFNMTYSSDEERKGSNKETTSITLEMHNTLSRKGSDRIKRKSMEKSQRKLRKIRAMRRDSSSEELTVDGQQLGTDTTHTKLKRRNAGEKKRNKRHFLRQSEVDTLAKCQNRLSLDLNSVLCSEHIGTGVCSRVFKGTCHDVPVAIKKLNRDCSKWRITPSSIEHDNITRLIGFEKEQMIVTELCEIGSLDVYLLKCDQKTTSPLTILSWMRDICSALLFLEDANIPLRSVSCRNILLNAARCAKLSLQSTSRYLNGQETHKIRWYPPDNKTSLVWSFGVTLLEAIHFGHFKYQDLLGLRFNNGQPIITFQSHVPILMRNLIKSCLRERISDRPSLKTVKDKMSGLLDVIVKAYNWKVKDPSSLMKLLTLEDNA